MQITLPKLFAAAALIALTSLGCVTLSRPIMPCPLTYSEQEKELLAVVPKGTRREDALRRLTAAGVEGSFGISQRVYYCDLWKRPNGDRWHVNVALLFDDTGKLYRTQVAECDVSVVPDENGRSASVKPDTSRRSAAAPAEAGSVNSTN
jgi:hypothetical protein